MNRLPPSLLLLALAACASTAPEKDVALAAADKDTICEREARTGTSLPTRRCRTTAQRTAEKEGVNQLEETRRNFQGMTTGK
jgi:hypothetical protein